MWSSGIVRGITGIVVFCCGSLFAEPLPTFTKVEEGIFYRDVSKSRIYHFKTDHRIETFDISGEAFLRHKGPYAPHIPGLSTLDIRVTEDGKPEIREKDAEAILAIAALHPGSNIFRTADAGLFYVLPDRETPTRRIVITTAKGDKVYLWRNIKRAPTKE